MKLAGRLAVGVGVALVCALVIGCQNGVSGPSLTATTASLSLVPTMTEGTELEANRNICCCHVTGTVTNGSSVPVNIELRFPAKSKQTGEQVGMGLDLQKSMAAGGTRSFVAVGIYAACNSLDLAQIQRDQIVNVRGLWSPD